MLSQPRVCAVSYLNTAPLVWGLLHGPQKGLVDLHFALPSECAERLRTADADVGLPPSIELAAQPNLVVIPGCSISSRGEAGSVLLVTGKPIEELETVAADTSSRSSVALAQIVLARKYHRHVKMRPYPPRIEEMLDIADAAVIIGDPALRFKSPAGVRPCRVYDLGLEWYDLTGLPMVFAVWVARDAAVDPGLGSVLAASAQYGLARLEQIAEAEGPRRGLSRARALDYLSRQLQYSWGEPESRGLSLFLEYAAELGLAPSRATWQTLLEPTLVP